MRTSSTFTTEFHQSFLAETKRLLRRRFLIFTAIFGGLGLLGLAMQLITVLFASTSDPGSGPVQVSGIGSQMWTSLALALVATLIYLFFFMYTWRANPSDSAVVRLSLALVALDGLMYVLLRALPVDAIFQFGLLGFMVTHIVAAAMLPWSAKQASLPAAVVLGVSAFSHLTFEGGPETSDAIAIAFSLFIPAPGVMICWLRHSSRLKDARYRFVSNRYGEVRRELSVAQGIHEAMFPPEKLEGDVCFTYRYAPMRAIGGDYLHVDTAPTECGTGETLSVVILDVTGHGIPAALTVNRLYGELSRIFGEDPGVAPPELIRLLNRYVNLTMSDHSVFVTAMCLKADPVKGVLEYASGGHPPAFMRTADGRIEQLDSTSMVLGALSDDLFENETASMPFHPGDRIVAYTDGAIEARSPEGSFFGIRGMQALLATNDHAPPGAFPETLLEIVDAHRGSVAEDDTLVVELFRPVRTAEAREAERLQAAQATP